MSSNDEGRGAASNAADLLERVGRGERSFRKAQLAGSDLRALDSQRLWLDYSNLEETTLRGVHVAFDAIGGAFDRADLEGAKLSGNLSSASFVGAKLARAELIGVFERADFAGADLSDATLSIDQFDGARFVGARLARAQLRGGRPVAVDFSDADLTEANLSGLSLKRWVLRGADLRGADLRGVDLSGVVLDGTRLEVAHLEGARLIDTDLSDADLRGARLVGADLRGARLPGARLEFADLTDADLRDVELPSVIGEVKFDNAILTRDQLGPVLASQGWTSLRVDGVSRGRAELERGVMDLPRYRLDSDPSAAGDVFGLAPRTGFPASMEYDEEPSPPTLSPLPADEGEPLRFAPPPEPPPRPRPPGGAPPTPRGGAAAPAPPAPLPAIDRSPSATLDTVTTLDTLHSQRPPDPDARGDAVDCSLFAPHAVPSDEPFLIQVFAHLPEQAAEAEREATQRDEAASLRARHVLDLDIPRGSRLCFRLALTNAELLDEPLQTLVWRGRSTSIGFLAQVNGTASSVLGKLVVSWLAAGTDPVEVPLGSIRFKLAVAREAALPSVSAPEPIGDAKRYRQAFISYATCDRDEVLRRVQVLEALRIKYFQDLLSIEPGERWERALYRHIDLADVFLLFWSSGARRSEWVKREIDYALARKSGEDASPPDIVPIVLEGPPPPPPPSELQHLQFSDRLLYFLREPPRA